MKKIFNKLRLAAIPLILFLGLVPVAHAEGSNFLVDFVADIGLTAIFKTISSINYFIGYVGGVLMFLGGNLTNWALNLNSQVIYSPTVQVGWVIARDIANLGFVLAIILIAFATILRMESYEMKKTLRNLIIAALLINFSLVIAGVFVDFAGVLTDFFVSKTTGNSLSGGAAIGEAFAKGLQVQKFLQVSNDTKKINDFIVGANGMSLVPFAASLFFTALFTAIAAISIFGLAAMLFIRYIALNILLVLMPLAWLFWIWPDLEGKWKQWWSEFFRWVFFAPAVSFFIYLALSLASSKYSGNLALGGVEQTLNPGNSLGLLTANDTGPIIGQMIAVLGVLIGGLITANKMGIMGADIALKGAGMASKMILGGGGNLISRGFGAAYKTTFGGGKTTFTEHLRQGASALSGIPVIGALARPANQFLASTAKAGIEQAEKNASAMDQEGRLKALKDRTLDVETLAGFMNSIAKNNELPKLESMVDRGEFPLDRFESIMKSSFQRLGDLGKAITAKNPALAGLKVEGVSYGTKGSSQRTAYFKNKDVKREIAIATKFMRPETADSIDPVAFEENQEALGQITKGFLSRYLDGRELSDQKSLVKYVQGHLDKIERKEAGYTEEIKNKIIGIASLIHYNPAWQSRPTSKLIPKRKMRGGEADF